MMEMTADPAAPVPPVANGAGLHSEKLYALWNIATQHHLGDAGRIRAILAESCKVLGVEIALVGEVVDGVYFVRYVHDVNGRFIAGMELPLAATPCQCVVERKTSVFLPDLPDDPALGILPVVSQLNLQVYAGTPIWADGKMWGVLAFAGSTALRSSNAQENLAFIELIANWIGLLQAQAIQRAKLENQALTDEMTGLLNRRAAEARLREEIAHAKRSNQPFVLALVDLDHFKLVNDRYGHGVGDEVLTGFARIFTQHLRPDDWVARWGGEEFLVCLHTDDIQHAELILERLREIIRQQAFVTSVGEIHVTMSVGLSCFDTEKSTQDSVLGNLDNTLYEAKSSGRDRIVSAGKGLGILQMASLLKQAAAEKRIFAAYQPIVDLNSREIVADEALVRLQTPQGEILPAASFIDAAEGLNLMADIDNIVVHLTMERCVRNLAAGTAGPRFAHFINLSPQFLARRNLVENLLLHAQGYCSACGVDMGPVKPVVFEITERQAILNLDTLEDDLKYLLDFGFRLALDDFGSGYSSFLYLSRLPISFLKIEGWMIQNMQNNPKALDLIKSLVSFARNQGITTIAEGVEDEETALHLRDVGVDWAQGYHFGHPVLG
jgi:diguanylate cyclase